MGTTHSPDGGSLEAQIKTAVANRHSIIDERLIDELPTHNQTLSDATRHLIDAGGKRLRPTLSLVVAEALSETPFSEIDYTAVTTAQHPDTEIDVLGGAASVELAHTFTLIHDDIMDNDDIRRGVNSVHTDYGNDLAILAGDTLHSRSMAVLLHTSAPTERKAKASQLFTETITDLCEGQVDDIDFETQDDVTLNEYINMITNKTAVLYGAAAAIPATLLGANDAVVDALYTYGINTGTAFQIKDDVLDLTTPSDVLGKQRGSDLIEGKQTVVTLHAKHNGVDVDSLISSNTVEEVTEAEIETAVTALEDAGSIAYAEEKAETLVESGKDELRVLPESDAKDMLLDLSDYLIERSY